MTNGVSGGGGLPVAGWYPDPAGSPQERWWSGSDWTDHLRAVPAAAPVWPTPAVPEAPSNPVWQPSPPLASPHLTTGAPAYQPMSGWNSGSNPTRAPYYPGPSGSPNTIPIWFVAIYPLPLMATTLLVSRLPFDILLTASALTSLVFFVLVAGSVVWDFLLLRQRGLPAASPAWVLLTPVGYLIARRVVLRHGGVRHNAPGNVFVIVLVGSAALLAFATSQLGRPPGIAVNTLETEIENALLEETSQVWDATCPPDAPFDSLGAEFTCTATSPAGATITVGFRVTREGLEPVRAN